jgi:drug/metabolite transporter (DMT)-like permease
LRPRDVIELVVLAALWGASFLIMRIASPAFGPVAVAALRVAGAALILMPLLAAQGQLAALAKHWRPIAAVGITNSALPFLAFAFAALSINAGLLAIFNSATPLFAAVVAWLWLADRLGPMRILGLAIGFAGVVWIAAYKSGFQAGGSPWAIPACLVAAISYAFSPNISKRYLTGVPPLAVAAGSQLAATLVLAGPTALAWPAQAPAPVAWLVIAVLAVFCTGLAYILYFRLIANAGPANAVAVTYLVPAFAIAWGRIFLGERLTWPLAVGCAVVLVGTALATGMIEPRLGNARRDPAAASDR